MAEPHAVTDIADRLRRGAVHLQARGISGLWLFGSTARGDATATSDIDLLADFDPAVVVTLVTLSSLRAELSELLGRPADLVDRSTLYPAVRMSAESDAIRVL